jgi:hypothetical protein
MINHSNEYARNLINWIKYGLIDTTSRNNGCQNKCCTSMAKTIEVLREYVKSYNSAFVAMAEYHSNIMKRSNSSASKVQ